MLVEAGRLEPRGETKGRFYVGTAEPARLRRAVPGERLPLRDPYPA